MENSIFPKKKKKLAFTNYKNLRFIWHVHHWHPSCMAEWDPYHHFHTNGHTRSTFDPLLSFHHWILKSIALAILFNSLINFMDSNLLYFQWCCRDGLVRWFSLGEKEKRRRKKWKWGKEERRGNIEKEGFFLVNKLIYWT